VAFLSPRQLAIAASTQRRGGRQRAVIPLLLGTIVIGFVWAFFAFGWLVVGPEGQQTCNCWADRYNDWQYQVQFLVALGGALSLAATAVSYLMRRPAALRVTGTITAAAICGWIGFLVTGSG
jgi:hypothetical protein